MRAAAKGGTPMMGRIIQAAIVLFGVPAALVCYITVVESLLLFAPDRTRPKIRPWLWIGPAVVLLLFYLVYPVLNTAYLSLFDAKSTQFVGFDNYIYAFTNRDMLAAMGNNVLWLIFFTLLTVTLGLLIAVLADRVAYESVVKSLIFLPMAISAVAAGVIWKFMFDYRPPGQPQTGTLNALLTTIPGTVPHGWLIERPGNTVALIFVGVWMSTGFCMVILSAGLKGIPVELLEAARMDGANEWQVFRRITLPLLSSTIAVIATTMVITALKAFDIVYVMTNGNFGTDVIANRMYKELFNVRNFGRASAIAVILLLAIIPVMLTNIRRFREQEAMR
jgi:alpha-glucoside transport system permease protein